MARPSGSRASPQSELPHEHKHRVTNITQQQWPANPLSPHHERHDTIIAMDDPWGSPWAEESQLHTPTVGKGNERLPVPTESPPKATTLALPQTTNSPWNDAEDDGDDTFGDWASEPVKDADELAFDITNSGWETSAPNSLDSPERHSSSAWTADLSALSSSKQAPNPRPISPAKQISADPWATEFSLNEALAADSAESDSAEISASPGDTTLDISAQTNESSRKDVMGSGFSDQDLNLDNLEAKTGEAPSTDVKNVPLPSKRLSDIETDRNSSRLSSSPSEGSQHGDEDGQPETPRTSMDDDPRRIQAHTELASPVIPSGKSSLTHVGDVSSGDDTYVEQSIQNGQSGGRNTSAIEHGESEDVSKERLSQPRSEIKGSISPNDKEIVTPKAPSSPSQIKSPRTAHVTIHNPDDIHVDISLMEKLFPHQNTRDVEEVFIPDIIPYESFSTTEQRKIWYRISRYGSMWKHNSGDEENYARVAWAGSTVKNDTLKIVARWMDEDRLSGQVMLGGSGRTSTLFGWGDAKTPAVSLDKIFASRKDKRFSTPPVISPEYPGQLAESMKPSPPSNSRHQRSASSTEDVEKISKSIAPPVADFGWSSTLPQVQLESAPNTPPPKATTAQRVPLPREGPTSSASAVQHSRSPSFASDQTANVAPSMEISGKNEVTAHAHGQGDSENDDDDWGDMVSTPVNNDTKNLALPQVLSSQHESRADSIEFQSPKVGINAEHASTLPSEANLNQITGKSVVEVPMQKNAPMVSSSIGDGWGATDFSFFDSPAAPAPQSNSAIKQSLVSKPARPSPLKQVSFSEVLLPSQKPRSITKVNETSNEDAIVQNVIKNLPDLSYMLKK